MGIRFNERALKMAEEFAANRLLRAAVFFQNEHRKFLSIQNVGVRKKRTRDTAGGKKGSQYTIYPNVSKPGEYPRRVTGEGSANVAYEPTTVRGVIDAGLKVRIGLRFAGKHLAILELWRHRLGFAESAKRLANQVKAILEK
jgi:hypothetical protein